MIGGLAQGYVKDIAQAGELIKRKEKNFNRRT